MTTVSLKLNGAVGLEPSVGFLHDFSDYQTKQSLVYDLQEPFRWLSDLSVIEAFESKALKLSDFCFTGDDYRYRFDPEARQRFIELLRERFNSGAEYNGRVLKWDTLIEQKASELGRLLVSRASAVDFAEPSPKFAKYDEHALRAKILTLTQTEAKKLGIGKSTFHNMRKKADCASSFQVYEKVRVKLTKHVA